MATTRFLFNKFPGSINIKLLLKKCQKYITPYNFSFILSGNAVCSVFGDPHYRTFDGRLYNFQGTCKYLLASDCSDERAFKIRVRNDGRGTTSYAWTKTLFISLEGYEVTLLQDYVVRVNRKDVTLPYVVSPALEITMDQYVITVKTAIGKKKMMMVVRK